MSPRPRMRHVFWLVAALAAAYVVVLPAVGAVFDPPPDVTGIQDLEEMSLGETVRLRATSAFFAVWFFALGACVGSFLNVYVYRSPRGVSLSASGSACPSCGTDIERRDNVPVVGWLRLGGRCRACREPISARYPLVEATVGGVFLTLFFAELLSGGRNLPERSANTYYGVVWILFYTKWDLVGLYAYHCVWLTVLLGWALVARDGDRVPWRSVAIAVASAATALAVRPALMLVPYGPQAAGFWSPSIVEALTASGLGGLAGAAAGLTLWPAVGAVQKAAGRRGFAASLALTGVVLGWQSALSVAAIALAALCGASLLRRRSVAVDLAVPVAAFVHLLTWRLHLSAADYWPVTRGPNFGLAVWAVVAAALAAAVWLRRPASTKQTNGQSEGGLP